jgi:hypothetical protein
MSDVAARIVPATVMIDQVGDIVSVSVEFETAAAATAFFDQISSDHLDKGVITIRSARPPA